jgi:phage baseplate assembly protein W
MFASNDDATAGLAMHYVRRALERWEPRIEILTLDAGAHPEVPHRLDVALAYRIRATLQTADLTFSMDLTGASY